MEMSAGDVNNLLIDGIKRKWNYLIVWGSRSQLSIFRATETTNLVIFYEIIVTLKVHVFCCFLLPIMTKLCLPPQATSLAVILFKLSVKWLKSTIWGVYCEFGLLLPSCPSAPYPHVKTSPLSIKLYRKSLYF